MRIGTYEYQFSWKLSKSFFEWNLLLEREVSPIRNYLLFQKYSSRPWDFACSRSITLILHCPHCIFHGQIFFISFDFTILPVEEASRIPPESFSSYITDLWGIYFCSFWILLIHIANTVIGASNKCKNKRKIKHWKYFQSF